MKDESCQLVGRPGQGIGPWRQAEKTATDDDLPRGDWLITLAVHNRARHINRQKGSLQNWRCFTNEDESPAEKVGTVQNGIGMPEIVLAVPVTQSQAQR